ncbi:sugar phosphate isomerase/epimerase [Devosia sp.]|uniref:sugar phosphate isomerase/epimerase family protein n=1 Tax=Devosia sp. TaxID=1871048 RepID=UPI0025F6321C|nr:sugar phosphate isomerase/epimerase family protein [Devosia sp.]MCR6637058.1 sugar phosphate isomerase/epimerase [Devosia sp.]
MKIGLSSYSFRPMLTDGRMTLETLFDWLHEHGAEHLEIATFSFAGAGTDAGYDLSADEEVLKRLEAAMARTGVPISGFCLGASFLAGDERRAQIDLVKRHVELCARFGAGFLRHDVVPWALRPNDAGEIEEAFAAIVEGCREVAEFGAQHGVVTSVEDHGFFMNGAERLLRLHHAVGHQNFKLTVDVGNFLCVDDNPYVATRRTLPHASFVHVKDFYTRRSEPGPGWLKTAGGEYIRGSVFGYGDLDTKALLESVVASGFDGFLSLEYEGAEPSAFGCEVGLNNIRRMLAEIEG